MREAEGSARGTVVYVYAVTPVAKKGLSAPRWGVDGIAPVLPMRSGDIVCWVSHVDAKEFGEELSERMENLEWLANAGVRHQQVVSSLAAEMDVLPARFGTVFSSEDALLADLQRRRRTIAATLKKVAGSEEWGVKVFVEPQRPMSTEALGATSGKDYLRRKAAVLEQRGDKRVDPDVAQFAAELKRAAVAAAPVGKVSGGQRNLVWQGAFLVKKKGRTKFQQVLRRFASKWSGERTIECTGPWPPYSFVGGDGR